MLDFKRSSMERKIGYVPQEHILFSKSVGDNIAFGKLASSPEEIEQAIATAAFCQDLERMSDGLATMIGERGVSISGGQKQRISIARAFLRDPDLLILDDSLSAVDARTERQIIQNIQKERSGKTNIIVTHRLSAVHHADWVLVLDEGRIVEEGHPMDLLASGGWYFEQYQRQQSQEGEKSESLRILLKQISRVKWLFAVGIGFYLLASTMVRLAPLLIQQAIDGPITDLSKGLPFDEVGFLSRSTQYVGMILIGALGFICLCVCSCTVPTVLQQLSGTKLTILCNVCRLLISMISLRERLRLELLMIQRRCVPNFMELLFMCLIILSDWALLMVCFFYMNAILGWLMLVLIPLYVGIQAFYKKMTDKPMKDFTMPEAMSIRR